VISRTVRIPRAGDRPLEGNLHEAESPSGAILVIHGFKGFKDWGFFPHLCDALARGGVTALRFNLGGCGVRGDGDQFDDVEGFEANTYGRELDDATIALDWLRAEAGNVPIGLFGHSRGGGVAILLGAERARVRALVTWAAISHPNRFGEESIAAWERGDRVPIVNSRTGQLFRLRRDILDELRADPARFDIAAHARRIDVPWLIVHGEQDETVPPGEARDLFEASMRGSRTARLLMIPEGGHTFGAVHPYAGEPAPLRVAVEETVAWCARSLGAA
jgi:dipeptidyl aminopeptidase/acylaminoacyl peptidase